MDTITMVNNDPLLGFLYKKWKRQRKSLREIVNNNGDMGKAMRIMSSLKHKEEFFLSFAGINLCKMEVM